MARIDRERFVIVRSSLVGHAGGDVRARVLGEPVDLVPTRSQPPTDTGSTPVPDVPDDTAAADAGISEGDQPGPTCRPSAAVSRQAMSAFVHRLADGPGVGV
jgi:hypothetical protein